MKLTPYIALAATAVGTLTFVSMMSNAAKNSMRTSASDYSGDKSNRNRASGNAADW